MKAPISFRFPNVQSRKDARVAAALAGMSLNEWMVQVILKAVQRSKESHLKSTLDRLRLPRATKGD